jgi:serine/threonine-protein kinase HipA
MTIRDRWRPICDAANMTEVDRNLLWRRQFLNPFAFEGSPAEISELAPS